MMNYTLVDEMARWAEATGLEPREVATAGEDALHTMWAELSAQRQDVWRAQDIATLDAIDAFRDYILAELASREPAVAVADDAWLTEDNWLTLDAERAAERAWSNCYTDHIGIMNPLEW